MKGLEVFQIELQLTFDICRRWSWGLDCLFAIRLGTFYWCSTSHAASFNSTKGDTRYLQDSRGGTTLVQCIFLQNDRFCSGLLAVSVCNIKTNIEISTAGFLRCVWRRLHFTPIATLLKFLYSSWRWRIKILNRIDWDSKKKEATMKSRRKEVRNKSCRIKLAALAVSSHVLLLRLRFSIITVTVEVCWWRCCCHHLSSRLSKQQTKPNLRIKLQTATLLRIFSGQ